MKKVLISSNNAHKISEMKSLLSPLGLEVVSLKDEGISIDVEETGTTFEENALLKAKMLYNDAYEFVIADDSGLSVDALEGAPGVYSARYAGEPCNDENNNKKLLAVLESLENSLVKGQCSNRKAKFVSVITAYFGNEDIIVTRGEVEGEILYEYRGNGGFGYDPLFYYPQLKKTFAELSMEEKNSISHRSIAMNKFIEELKKKVLTK